MTYKMKHTEFMWPNAIKSSHLFWLVNHQENKAICGYQREVEMVIQLGSIQRFAVSVRKDVSYRGRKVGLQKKLDMKEAQWLTKQWACEKDSELFYKLEHWNLITKNLSFDKHCRKDFTRSKKSCNPVSCTFLPK